MKNIVVIGGGTGNFVVLSGLKQYPLNLSAIVSMADDGGSTGILRDELGVLPPGDVRQCLVALSSSSELMRNLINYRFENGALSGHSFGNLFLSALEKVTGSFERAVEELGKILSIKGKVFPITANPVRLHMLLNNGKVLKGEKEIYLSNEIDKGYKSIYLVPEPKVNQNALDEILHADLIVLGPGGLHTSLIPNLLVEKVNETLMQAPGLKIFVMNLMNRNGSTTHYKASDYLNEIVRFIGKDIFDFIITNNEQPPPELMELYRTHGELVQNDLTGERVLQAPLLGQPKERQKGDMLQRNLIRHDPKKLADLILTVIKQL